jgi:hypothetical protein
MSRGNKIPATMICLPLKAGLVKFGITPGGGGKAVTIVVEFIVTMIPHESFRQSP